LSLGFFLAYCIYPLIQTLNMFTLRLAALSKNNIRSTGHWSGWVWAVSSNSDSIHKYLYSYY
jgi:hypothetical protein